MAANLFKKIFGGKEKKAKRKKSSAKKKPAIRKRSPAKKKTAKKKTAKKKPKAAGRKKLKGKISQKKQPKKAKEIGVVTHYFGKISVGIIKVKATLKAGDKIEIKGAHVDFSQQVKSMQINHQDAAVAGKNAEVGIKVKKRVHPNDKVYKKVD